MSITVVIPSRGRPERAWDAVDAALGLAALPSTHVMLAIDDDDPRLDDYLARQYPNGPGGGWSRLVLSGSETGNLVRATNSASRYVATTDHIAEQYGVATIIGNLGDDHMVRTEGWDAVIENALRSPGIAYGDDLLQGERLPTAPFISTRIVNALGWYALPSCRHMYIDDAWKAIGNELGILRYRPEVVIEHVHPGAGKVETDDGYARADSSTTRDLAAYQQWRNTTFFDDVLNVRRALRR